MMPREPLVERLSLTEQRATVKPKVRALRVAAPAATPRHAHDPLPLLPSGPGGVYGLSLRGDRRDYHNTTATAQGPPRGAHSRVCVSALQG